eukprot:CAMPEP_0197306282 /NCGR_PEP_ID=MMETSP0891-20130614/2954_1 /TAXON_ID=44058 ORGANISM="Aureoumbra lagunensis, Strain CCMP1510" /NCGR_SAMPLE_ID=MMETSP0891 /ASSEMBLY_ACC=CAM_ASM_000534 /LENGTH=108 /DNA_ID=CAMNT_0042788303 /DNA_START=249 /DNA_END=575 /DNA_ORIENTATION=-
MAWAYRSVALQRRIRLLSKHQIPQNKSGGSIAKKEREEAQIAFEAKTSDISCAYALMTVNAAYLILWIACAFSILPKLWTDMSSNINHLIAIAGTSIFLASRAATFLA